MLIVEVNNISTYDTVSRPTKLTDITVKKLEEAFALDCSIPEACQFADISRQTYYNWEKENTELFDRFSLLRSKPMFLARQTVINAIEKDVRVAQWYLERKKKDEFAQRVEGETKSNFTVEDLIAELDKQEDKQE